MKAHFVLFARYNRWANRRLYEAAEALDELRLWEDLGAFFGSLGGTLNHVLVGDRIWLARIRGEALPRLALDTVLHRELGELRAAREAEDGRIESVVDALSEDALAGELIYTNLAGDRFSQRLSLVLAHLFNHQAHHRGQAHVLIGQLGGTPPPLDLIHYLREIGEG